MTERLDPDKIGPPSIKGRLLKLLGLYKNPYVENLKKRYSFCNKYIKDKIVLDIPCGVGWGSSLLKGYKELYGVDISEKAISKAKRKYPRINLKSGKMEKIPFNEDFFDVVICLEGIEHVTFLEGQKFFEESKRVLKNDGNLIITTPLLINEKYHSGNKYHLCEYKEEEFIEIVKGHGYTIFEKDYLRIPKSKVLRVVLEVKKENDQK